MINEEIRAKEVRLIDAEGTQVGIVPIAEALAKAAEANLDLVNISPNAAPPVCRIMDYGKYRYEQQKKEKEARKKQKTMEVKEMRLGIF
ncbi:MAG: translation initiation factor IF-3, partial [Firmicutes bacterium]|nr:translation initiation factor IF-3 [Bacillota bacterium]